MDRTARSSATRPHTVVALTVFAFFSFLLMLVLGSETQSFVHYDRRDVLLIARQGQPRSTGASSGASVTSTSSSVSSPSPSPSSSSTSFSSSTTPTFLVSSSPPTTLSSISSSSFTSVSPTHSASTVSPSSSQSTQTLSTLAASSEKLPTSSKTTTTRFIGSENRAPATTLAIPNNFMPTFTPPLSEPASSSSSAPPAVTPLSAAATTSSLWQKKGAVAAIFVIVALVILAITAILVVAFLKRRSARREVRLHDELFEKYTEPERRSPSPSASITAVPMDPFATSTVRYDTPPLFSDYAVPQSPPFVRSTSPVQHPDYCNQSPSRYLTPSQAQAARSSAHPSAFRGPEHRDSYQPSIDSFYGAGQPSGFST